MPTSRLYISLDAIIANYLSLDALSGRRCATGAAVKADAYGLGMTAIAPALHKAGCRHFFVARLDEALSLRKTFRSLNLQADIIVFDGPRSGEMNDYSAFDIIPTLNHEAQLPLLRDEAIRTQSTKRAYLHTDTAMSRLGMTTAATAAQICENPSLLCLAVHVHILDTVSWPSRVVQVAVCSAATKAALVSASRRNTSKPCERTHRVQYYTAEQLL